MVSTIKKYGSYLDPNALFRPENKGRLYVVGAILGILLLWIIYRKLLAKRPEDGADAYNDPTDGDKNTGIGKNSPYIDGGKINTAYFATIGDLFQFLNKDGNISPTDAAHEIYYAVEANRKDWSINGCENSIKELCAQLGTLANQSDDYIRATNREYRRIYGKGIHDELPNVYNVFTCKCDNNAALKAKFSKLI